MSRSDKKNDSPTGSPGDEGTRRKRLKGTLVGFRVPDKREPPAAEASDGPPDETTLWGGADAASRTKPVPRKDRAAVKGTMIGGIEAPALPGGRPRSSPPATSPAAPPLASSGPPHTSAAPRQMSSAPPPHTSPLPHQTATARAQESPIPPPGATDPLAAQDAVGEDAPTRTSPPAGIPYHAGRLNLPSAQRLASNAPRAEPAPPVEMNKWTYRLTIFGGLAGAGALGLWSTSSAKLAALVAFLVWIPLVPALLMQCVFLHKMWTAIQDGYARTSPGKAVGYLFIPIFNLYWLFEVFPGFATDYNAYRQRHGVDAPPLSRSLFLAALLLPGIGLVVHWIVIGRVCDAVSSLSS